MGRDYQSGQFEIPTTIQEPVVQEKKQAPVANPEVGPMSAYDMRGYWPEIIDAFLLLMVREDGAGFFQRIKADRFLRKHADDIFEKAAIEFERLPASLRADGQEDKKRFEQIAFRLFNAELQEARLLRYNKSRSDALKTFLKPREEMDIQPLAAGLNQEEVAAIRDLVSPEELARIQEKTAQETMQVIRLQKDRGSVSVEHGTEEAA